MTDTKKIKPMTDTKRLQKTNKRKQLGRAGEEYTRAYLIRNGYRILESNYTCRIGEIDLITAKENLICFVEVKSRKHFEYGMPCESVANMKQRHIWRTAEYYLMKEWDNCGADSQTEFRFDVSEVIFREETYEINYIEDAFRS